MDKRIQSRTISQPDLAALGVEQIAYVKPVMAEDKQVFSLHAADGSPLTVVPSREIAEAVLRQHDLSPVSVH